MRFRDEEPDVDELLDDDVDDWRSVVADLTEHACDVCGHERFPCACEAPPPLITLSFLRPLPAVS